MFELQQEKTLAKVRLHWGIFVPVGLLAVTVAVTMIPAILLAGQVADAFKPLLALVNQSSPVAELSRVWLIPVSLGLIVILCFAVATWISYAKSEVTLTNQRLLFRTGFLSRHSGEVPLENVESIFISESMLARLCGYGTVTVTTVGGSNFALWFVGGPRRFHAALQEAVSGARSSFKRPPKSGGQPPDDDSRYRPKR